MWVPLMIEQITVQDNRVVGEEPTPKLHPSAGTQPIAGLGRYLRYFPCSAMSAPLFSPLPFDSIQAVLFQWLRLKQNGWELLRMGIPLPTGFRNVHKMEISQKACSLTQYTIHQSKPNFAMPQTKTPCRWFS